MPKKGESMELHFKDRKSAELFNEKRGKKSSVERDDGSFLDSTEMEEIEVSSNPLSLDYLEAMSKKIEKKNEEPKATKSEREKSPSRAHSSSLPLDQLNRIESKQNAILEILEHFPLPKVSEVERREPNMNEEELLHRNLELFNRKFVILRDDSEMSDAVKKLLGTLEMICEHIYANSFYIFTRDNSPVKSALRELDYIGMGKAELNYQLTETEKLLKKIDTVSSMEPFERSHNYSKLLLDRGLILNAITILNEATGMYIIESAKTYSKQIDKYITLIGEENSPRLYSRAKEYFSNLPPDNEEITIPLFPHHKFVKDIDREIGKKLKNIRKTWSNKGDGGLFEKYAHISNRIREIRNTLAHADMERSFRSLKKELVELNDDFYYLAVKKNILKR